MKEASQDFSSTAPVERWRTTTLLLCTAANVCCVFDKGVFKSILMTLGTFFDLDDVQLGLLSTTYTIGNYTIKHTIHTSQLSFLFSFRFQL